VAWVARGCAHAILKAVAYCERVLFKRADSARDFDDFTSSTLYVAVGPPSDGVRVVASTSPVVGREAPGGFRAI